MTEVESESSLSTGLTLPLALLAQPFTYLVLSVGKCEKPVLYYLYKHFSYFINIVIRYLILSPHIVCDMARHSRCGVHY